MIITLLLGSWRANRSFHDPLQELSTLVNQKTPFAERIEIKIRYEQIDFHRIVSCTQLFQSDSQL